MTKLNFAKSVEGLLKVHESSASAAPVAVLVRSVASTLALDDTKLNGE